ncbi:MAG: hypothetical protein V1494_03125 [Candidatus Diapherotrites archaeon]
MNLNIFSPKNAVASAYEKPNMALAFALVLLPVIVSAVIGIALGAAVNPLAIVVLLVKAIVAWLVSGIILYVILYLFKGKSIDGKFNGILCALSVFYLLSLVIGIITIGLLFVLFPGLGEVLQSTVAQGLSVEEASALLAGMQGTVGVSIVSVAIFFIAVLAMVVYSIYFLYRVISESAKSGLIVNLLVLLIFAALNSLASGFLGGIGL